VLLADGHKGFGDQCGVRTQPHALAAGKDHCLAPTGEGQYADRHVLERAELRHSSFPPEPQPVLDVIVEPVNGDQVLY
jgi:hypothetical protein